jgi:crossover junction endodeoxyribonuclease RuvC
MEASMIVLGIDIGVTGALTALDSRGAVEIRDLPTQQQFGKAKTGSKAMVKRRLCPVGLMRLVREFIPAGEVGLALYEDVHSMPGDSGPAGFSLGESRGIVRAVLELARLDAHAVQPQAWKRHYGIVKDKTGSIARERASILYPSAAPMLARVKDHNRADSLLIAHYGKVTLA